MLVMGCPVLGRNDLTIKLINSLIKTVSVPEQFHFVIIDNASPVPYNLKDLPETPFKTTLIRNEKNTGYYYPITDLCKLSTTADLVGLTHNDMVFWEKGWDQRVVQSFVLRPTLGMIGVCGSFEVDQLGGRGKGTMSNFADSPGCAEQVNVGLRVRGLNPAIVLDSMVMITRQNLVPLLAPYEGMPLSHFFDRVWPLRLVEHNREVGVLGILCDHGEGGTMKDRVSAQAFDDDAYQWCIDNGAPVEGLFEGQPWAGGGMGLYLECERRYLDEYLRQKNMLPAWVDRNWRYQRGLAQMSQISVN